MKSTYEWEKILHRVPDSDPEWWWPSPSIRKMNQVYDQTPPEISAYEAVVEVVRLRKNLESLKTFVDNFPLVPPLVGTGSIEDRAKEMQATLSHTISLLLEGEEQ